MRCPPGLPEEGLSAPPAQPGKDPHLLPEQVSGGSTQTPLPGDRPALWPQPKSMTLEKCWPTPAQGSGRPL